ncbi:MAG: DUF167 domain-containing protein [Alphaproteobacteria bacterium]
MKKVVLQIRLTPGAKRTGWQGLWNGTHWRVAVRERAIDNKANQALIEFLADETGVPPKNITITHGQTSRQKQVEITGIDTFVPPMLSP